MQWEVEALELAELRRMVLAAVDPYIDRDVVTRQIAGEEAQRRALAAFLDGWDAAGGGHPRSAVPARGRSGGCRCRAQRCQRRALALLYRAQSLLVDLGVGGDDRVDGRRGVERDVDGPGSAGAEADLDRLW